MENNYLEESQVNNLQSNEINQQQQLNQNNDIDMQILNSSDSTNTSTLDSNQQNIELNQELNDNQSITSNQLADCLSNSNTLSSCVVIDSRSFIEYNSCHIQEAINLCCSKIVKRRLQNNKITIRDLINNVNNGSNLDNASLIVIYDQGSLNISNLGEDSCLKVLWSKLITTFKNVRFLIGGFNEFHQNFNAFCTNKSQITQNFPKKSTHLEAISQPCLPNIGPTRILPFLYLGSQVDAMNHELLKNYNITYILNVSTNCPKPSFIQDSHFLRIPVNDNYNDKLLPHFPQAINFLDKVRESSGCVLVHCLGGISRSATVAIAFIMQHMKMSSDDAYRYLKGKRATISPNFNFLGQLLDYEKQLIDSKLLPPKKNLTEHVLLKMTREKHENGETDNYLPPLTPSLCNELGSKQFNSSSPKHHVLHHHFNPHLMNQSNQEKKTLATKLSTSSEEDELADLPTDGSSSHNSTANNSINNSTINLNSSTSSQFSNLSSNGAQKRTCSFSSSPNTRNKMTLKLQVNETDNNLNSIVFM